MIHFFLPPFSHRIKKPSKEHEIHLIPPIPDFTSEGGEFLDDALRMKEQPLTLTETSVGVGSPEQLL